MDRDSKLKDQRYSSLYIEILDIVLPYFCDDGLFLKPVIGFAIKVGIKNSHGIFIAL